MEVIRNCDKMHPCALALGNFDGLHKAHIKIIKDCVVYAKANKLKSGVFLFENHTDEVCKGKKVELLTTLAEKISIIKSLGADFIFVKHFDEETMNMNPLNFFSFLCERLLAKALFAGFDYTFGKGAKGDAKFLLQKGREYGVYLKISEEIKISDAPVKSNTVRVFIKNGEIEKANEYLGRRYFVSGAVSYGKQNGRRMGFPTANIDYDKNKLLPPDGVYRGVAKVEEKEYPALINIGKNPTFDAELRTVEAHLLNFTGDLYGKNITIEFDSKIRNEIKFNDIEELKEQIKRDIQNLINKEI